MLNIYNFSYLISVETLLLKKNKEGFHACKTCGYKSRKYIDVRRHIESRHVNLKITCIFCDTVFKTNRTYREHVKRHHPAEVLSVNWETGK